MKRKPKEDAFAWESAMLCFIEKHSFFDRGEEKALTVFASWVRVDADR